MKPVMLSESEVEAKVVEYMKSFKTGIIATIDENNQAYSSVVTIIKQGNIFYSLISETAPHYDHLKSNSRTQIIFAEDESVMQSSFLRKRVSFDLEVSFIEDDESIYENFTKEHGEMVTMLRRMDFSLIKMEIKGGKAIFGAGQAYFLDENEKCLKQDMGKGMGHGHPMK